MFRQENKIVEGYQKYLQWKFCAISTVKTENNCTLIQFLPLLLLPKKLTNWIQVRRYELHKHSYLKTTSLVTVRDADYLINL